MRPSSPLRLGTGAAAAVLLAGPVALAFASGAYFDGPRTTALLGCAVVLAVLAACAPDATVLPRGAAGRAALAGLWLLAGWVALSGGRSPLPGVASDDAERVVLYAGFLLAGAVAWGSRPAARAAEPLLAGGVVVVVVYGLAGRWLPGLIDLAASRSAGGRLEQPLTYWNAMGMLAALGAVLCVRIAGDRDRPDGLSAAAAAGAVPLLCGVYLSFSRGSVAALVAGLLVLVVCAPGRGLLRAAAVIIAAGAVAVAVSGLLPGVRALEGSTGARERDGLIALLVTLAAMAVAAVVVARARRAGARSAREDRIRLPRWAGPAVAAVVVAAVVVPVLAATDERAGGEARFGANAQRFTSVTSNRYDYWRVAVRTFRDHPVSGIGSGGWATRWLQERPSAVTAQDAHSIELETLAELGLVGFVLLLAVLGGVGRSAAVALRRDRELLAGPCAALTVWAAHSALDWDWEMPGVTLPALTLAGLAIARAAPRDRPPRGRGAALLGRGLLVAAAVVCAVVGLTARHSDARCRDLRAAAGRLALDKAPARTVLDDAIETCSDPQDTLNVVGAVYLVDRPLAIEGIRRLSRRNPDNWVVWLARMRLEGSRAQRRAARARVLALNPRYAGA